MRHGDVIEGGMTDLVADVTLLGSTRQTNALLFYSLGDEVDKGRSRTVALIYNLL